MNSTKPFALCCLFFGLSCPEHECGATHRHLSGLWFAVNLQAIASHRKSLCQTIASSHCNPLCRCMRPLLPLTHHRVGPHSLPRSGLCRPTNSASFSCRAIHSTHPSAVRHWLLFSSVRHDLGGTKLSRHRGWIWLLVGFGSSHGSSTSMRRADTRRRLDDFLYPYANK